MWIYGQITVLSVHGPSSAATGEEVEHDVREFVRALDLWHMADAGEEMCLGVRHEAVSGFQMMRGQYAIAVPPDDQCGARVLRCGTG